MDFKALLEIAEEEIIAEPFVRWNKEAIIELYKILFDMSTQAGHKNLPDEEKVRNLETNVRKLIRKIKYSTGFITSTHLILEKRISAEQLRFEHINSQMVINAKISLCPGFWPIC